MVPAGSGPFVWEEEEMLRKRLKEIQLEFKSTSWVVLVLVQIADLYDLCEGVSGSLACDS